MEAAETKTETSSAKPRPGPPRSWRGFLVLTRGGGCGIRTRGGLRNPLSNSEPVVLSRPRRSGVSADELLATLDGRRRTVANETGTETGDRLLVRQAWYCGAEAVLQSMIRIGNGSWIAR